MKKGWSEVTFTDFSTLVRREAPIDDDGEYPEVGVRCFGKGLFHKLARTGLEVGDKKLFRLKEGDFILQVTFAWEGAVAIVGKEDETFFGSVRVLTFEIDAAICDTRFLLWYFRTATGVAQLARISPGTAGRNKVLSIGRLGEMKIPLPPLAEQQRIVAHLDAIESRLTRVKKLREEIAKEAEAFTTSLHLAAAKGRMVRLGQLMRLDETKESVTAEGSYPQIGIRSFGMGLFKKPSVLGANTTYRAFNVLSCGQFVMSQVKGWEGAVGVAKEDCEGWFASPEYRTFSCIEDECDWKPPKASAQGANACAPKSCSVSKCLSPS
jgi:type I restriction enzyme, S subunit